MTTSKSFKIIFIIWLISTALATHSATPDSGADGILITDSFYCRVGNKTPSKQVAWCTSLCVILFLLVTITLTMYARIFVIGHKRQKMLQNGELGETNTGQNQRSVLRQDLKTVRMYVDCRWGVLSLLASSRYLVLVTPPQSKFFFIQTTGH